MSDSPDNTKSTLLIESDPAANTGGVDQADEELMRPLQLDELSSQSSHRDDDPKNCHRVGCEDTNHRSRCLPSSIMTSPRFRTLQRVLTTNLISDNAFRIKRVVIIEGPEGIRLLKFLTLTVLLIIAFQPINKWVDWEHDPDYSVKHFFLYDFPHVCLDITSFFIIGRLYQRKGVDRLFPQILPMIFGIIFPSWEGDFWFLRHSVSMYEIFCQWPWQLFLYVIFVAIVFSLIFFLHLRYMYRTSILPSRLFVFGLMLLIFLAPYISNPNFHFHHWYASWLFGMHANLDTWWSQTTMAFIWGQYINGIAVYGRDPILSCAYAFYISTDIHCPYMKCYYEDDDDAAGGGGGGYKPFVAPTWRNCSAADNYNPM